MVRGAVCDLSRTLYAYTSESILARVYIFSDEEIYGLPAFLSQRISVY